MAVRPAGGRGGRRRGKPTAIGNVVARVLGDLGLDGAQRAFEVARCWEGAVGADVARHARPVAMRQGVLEVVVDSSVWAQQLQLRQPEILEALARALAARAEAEGAAPAGSLAEQEEGAGTRAPSGLRFRVGYTARP